jgi:putative endonuclease
VEHPYWERSDRSVVQIHSPRFILFLHPTTVYYVYIIQSEKSGRYYTGFTDDLERRLNEHNNGENPSTRNKGPWELVYSEEYGTRSEAVNREREIKAKKSRKSIQ